MTDEATAVRDLFLYHLRDTYGRGFQPSHGGQAPSPTTQPGGQAVSLTGGGVGLTTASDGDHTLTLEVRPLIPSEDTGWLRRRDLLQELIADDLPARIALWVPAGADLPNGEPHTGEFVVHARQAATRLGPHERSYVPFPARLLLRKNAAEGGVISVTGGLNPHWARFTDRVRGQFDLDSTSLHRLPESEEHLETLISAIVDTSKELDIKQVATIDTIDAWTIQRLSGDNGVTILGASPAETADLGLAIRRNFRRTILDTVPTLRQSQTDLTALVVQVPYARADQEGATTSLRGYDPASYSGIDFIALATDGIIKPLIQPTEARLPWNRAATA